MNYFTIAIFMAALGMFSSGIGCGIGGILNQNSGKIKDPLYMFTSGIMTGIVCFDMLPECIEMSNFKNIILGIVIGCAIVYIVKFFNDYVDNKNNSAQFVVALSMAVHNILEGVAIGAGFSYSSELGLALLISIFLHDIPEGIVVGAVSDNKRLSKIIINSGIVGMVVGIGVYIGLIIGNISKTCISICLSVAAGAMLYVTVSELLTNYDNNYKSNLSNIVYIIGIIIPFILVNI